MTASILTSVIADISTNIDDVFVIMILLAQAAKRTKGQIVAGHFLGVAIITVISIAMITLGNGADNVGVYIPLFAGFSGTERVGAVAVFAVMTALWILLANSLAEFPHIKTAVGKYRQIVIPVVFIALGIYIILDSGLLG